MWLSLQAIGAILAAVLAAGADDPPISGGRSQTLQNYTLDTLESILAASAEAAVRWLGSSAESCLWNTAMLLGCLMQFGAGDTYEVLGSIWHAMGSTVGIAKVDG